MFPDVDGVVSSEALVGCEGDASSVAECSSMVLVGSEV